VPEHSELAALLMWILGDDALSATLMKEFRLAQQKPESTPLELILRDGTKREETN
jgi:hypothetical protein